MVRGRVTFLVFAIGLFLGAWLGEYMRPPLKQLPVKVDCAPAGLGV